MPSLSTVKALVPGRVKLAIRALLNKPSARSSYVPAAEAVSAAKAAGLSVTEYVEQLWNQPGRSAAVMHKLAALGAVSASTKSIVEIGPGTGRYIGATLKLQTPNRYQIYETALDWRTWLASEYPIEACNADGRTLGQTPNHSADLIHAHGVFVYIPFLVTYRYFEEIVRVAAPHTFVAFDILSEPCLSDKTVADWLKAGDEYPCFLSKGYAIDFFAHRGFQEIHSFFMPYGAGRSEYLIFRRQ
jgi:hypothetical protein